MPKRVLIVTYYWPPSGGSGVQRWLKFAKYLPELGWDVTVAAPQDADYEITDKTLITEVPESVTVLRVPIREPYAAFRTLTGSASRRAQTRATAIDSFKPSPLKRFAYWIRANFFVPDPKILWVKPTTAALRHAHDREPFDVVVTTGPPHSVHLIGRELKTAFPELLWAVDIRDPWSKFDVHLDFNPGRRARSKNRQLERDCLREADLVLGTAFSMPALLEPFDKGKYVTITNGYDAADFGLDDAEYPPSRDRFHLYHTGLLTASRNPAACWRALALLCERDAGFAERLHIHLVGTVDEVVRRSLDQHDGLRGKWTITPWVDHTELLRRYREADAFLLCPNQTDNAKAQINGKVFEYLAMRRPVLHVGPYDADNTTVLDAAHAGLTVPPGDVEGAVAAIENIASGKFAASPHAFNQQVIERYDRRATARQLSDVLHAHLAKRR